MPDDDDAKLVTSATREARALISPAVTSKLNVTITRPLGANAAAPKSPISVPGAEFIDAAIGCRVPASTTQGFGLGARDVPVGS